MNLCLLETRLDGSSAGVALGSLLCCSQRVNGAGTVKMVFFTWHLGDGWDSLSSCSFGTSSSLPPPQAVAGLIPWQPGVS